MKEYIVMTCHKCDEAAFINADFVLIDNMNNLQFFIKQELVAAFNSWEFFDIVDNKSPK